MNLVLIGYRGTGKSAAARILADRLALRRISMDEDIVRRAGRSIPDIVAEHGWPYFRVLEAEVARDLARQDGLVIDTGGGVIERVDNVAALQSNGMVVWLQASVDTIVSRIASGTERPALVDGKTFTEEVAEVLHRRTPLYTAAAYASVDTDEASIEQVVDRVEALWRRRLNNQELT